ncbi:MAG: hypothetical protein QME96_00255 [Myxococcota bacterium]|nr:hypothetical protein [Myxococcota bacterium]
MTRTNRTGTVVPPHPLGTAALLVASIAGPLVLGALAGCHAAVAQPPAEARESPIQLVCQGEPTQEIAPPLVEAVSLDRLPANCTWEGTSFPIFGRRAAGRGAGRYDAIYYRPPLRPVGPPRVDTISDPSGVMVRIDLATRLPHIRSLCRGVDDIPPELLAGAQPLSVYALDVRFESPMIPGECHLRSAGSVHHPGDAEVVRLRFRTKADADAFISAITDEPGDLTLRIRYAVAGVVNVPTSQPQGLGGPPLAVAWFEETVRGNRSCAGYCQGCCDEQGTCHEPQRLTRSLCAIDQPGGQCGRCPGFSLCDVGVCREAALSDALFDIDLVSVRIEGYSNCDMVSACDFTAVVRWTSLRPGLTNSAGGGPDDADRARLNVRMARDARETAIRTPFRVWVYDRDLTEDEYMTDCALMLNDSDLQRAAEAARRYRTTTMDWACGRGIYLTFSLNAHLDDEDDLVAQGW